MPPEEIVSRPTAEQVLARAICLTHQLYRFNLETLWEDAGGKRAREELQIELRNWRADLEDDLFFPAATQNEAARFSADLGEWAEEDIDEASFGVQAIPYMLWALSLIDELPAAGEQLEELPEIPNFESADDLIGRTSVRSDEELELLLEEAHTLLGELPEDVEDEASIMRAAAIIVRVTSLEWLLGEFEDWDEAFQQDDFVD